MQVRSASSFTVALAAALSGCGGQRVHTTNRHLPAAIATPPNDAALLRVSRSGGTAELLRANSLVARTGPAVTGLPTITRLLAATPEDETVYATDNAGRLVAIDLRNQRVRQVATSARQFTATPDGTILGVDSAHHPVRLLNRAFTTSKVPVDKGTTLLRGPADQVLAVGNRPATLQVLGSAGELRHLPIPNGSVTTTWVGDLVAITTDSGVAFVDPNPSAKGQPRKAPPKFIKLRGTPTVSAFSPSGHRLYVGRKVGGLAMVDRFTREKLKELDLAAAVDGLRADRSGRWLLAHGAVGDSLWVIDVTRWALAWSGTAPWAEDLPQVIDGHVLVVRHRSDLVAIDLLAEGPPEGVTLAGAASDLYIMLQWVPKPASSGAAADPAVAAAPPPPVSGAQTAPATPAPAASPAAAVPPPAPAAGNIYLQVSASQNAEWAQALAKQLKESGFPARVLDPKTSDESYRVVVGPYGSRDEADAAGKRLGRPYFIMNPGPGDT